VARPERVIPVLVNRDVPGFVENRILYAIKLAVIGPLELLE